MPASSARTTAQIVPYDRDYYAWTAAQSLLLRAKQPGGLDWENLAEEIESLGRADKRSIASNLNVLLLHLLKWNYQPGKRKADWRGSIAEHRDRLNELVGDSPSLGTYPADVLWREYATARLKAAGEIGLAESTFPSVCPFTAEEILDPGFWPER